MLKKLSRDFKMVTIYTIGFTKKSLEEFSNKLKKDGITKLIDIRLNRNSQLSGFAKERDLKYVLERFLDIKYEIMEDLAPTEELLKNYRESKDWGRYETEFKKLMNERELEKFRNVILDDRQKICFLCSESEPDKCHRRIVSEFFQSLGEHVSVKHL